MAAPVTCQGCLADDQDLIERLGLEAMNGVISWRAAQRELGWSDPRSLKNHIENHYVEALKREQDVELQDFEALFASTVEEAIADLFVSMRMAPPEVKPLYATAIRNLKGLADTKPSQQHLIAALKTIQEMTGMKQEQRMMLQFAEAMYREMPSPQRVPVLSASTIDIEPLGGGE